MIDDEGWESTRILSFIQDYQLSPDDFLFLLDQGKSEQIVEKSGQILRIILSSVSWKTPEPHHLVRMLEFSPKMQQLFVSGLESPNPSLCALSLSIMTTILKRNQEMKNAVRLNVNSTSFLDGSADDFINFKNNGQKRSYCTKRSRGIF
jgi:hypothetical protein